ncbi:MAG: ATP synthase F1 subunit delta [Myxococcales bacterium]|nr:MAG: ATP synthase F1 subunit delta [Myxococcales bacterium]
MSVIASRYAKALFKLGQENNQLDQFEQELKTTCKLWEQSPDLHQLVDNPGINAEQRRAVFADIAERMGLSKTIRNTLWILSDRKRMMLLPDIVERFEELAEQSLGRLRAEVTTATKLPDSYYEQLRHTLEAVSGKKIILQSKIDPTILAGVVTRIGDQVFDGSARSYLAELKDELLDSQNP